MDGTARNEKMAAMYRQGLSLAVIGREFGVTRERVRQILARFGLRRRDGGQHIQAEAKKQAIAARRDAQCLARWGVGYAEMKQARSSGLLAAYVNQRNAAKNRGVQWNLTYSQWLSVWEASGKLAERGRGKAKYAMSRIKDTGGYEIGNVHIQTNQENAREAVKKWRGKQKQHRGVYFLYPGLARPYLATYGGMQGTRLGFFATEAEAAQARVEYMSAHGLRPAGLGGGRGWTYDARQRSRPYVVNVRNKRIGSFATEDEAVAAYRSHVEQLQVAV